MPYGYFGGLLSPGDTGPNTDQGPTVESAVGPMVPAGGTFAPYDVGEIKPPIPTDQQQREERLRQIDDLYQSTIATAHQIQSLPLPQPGPIARWMGKATDPQYMEKRWVAFEHSRASVLTDLVSQAHQLLSAREAIRLPPEDLAYAKALAEEQGKMTGQAVDRARRGAIVDARQAQRQAEGLPPIPAEIAGEFIEKGTSLAGAANDPYGLEEASRAMELGRKGGTAAVPLVSRNMQPLAMAGALEKLREDSQKARTEHPIIPGTFRTYPEIQKDFNRALQIAYNNLASVPGPDGGLRRMTKTTLFNYDENHVFLDSQDVLVPVMTQAEHQQAVNFALNYIGPAAADAVMKIQPGIMDPPPAAIAKPITAREAQERALKRQAPPESQ